MQKTPDDKIQAIRDMRLKGYSQAFICNALHTNIYVVKKYTKDIKIDLRKTKNKLNEYKEDYPCITYPFSQLSQQDQDKYNKIIIISPAVLFEMRCNETKMRYLGRLYG
jgi:hypothetical protein